MIAAGKKNRLKMKYPTKLWPFRPATRAGQNAIAIQTTASTIHQMFDMTYSPKSATTASAPNIPRRSVTDASTVRRHDGGAEGANVLSWV